MTNNSPISKEFVGVVLLPIICRVPHLLDIVRTSVEDKLSLSMGITVGSSIVSGTSLLHRKPADDFFKQIALFVIP